MILRQCGTHCTAHFVTPAVEDSKERAGDSSADWLLSTTALCHLLPGRYPKPLPWSMANSVWAYSLMVIRSAYCKTGNNQRTKVLLECSFSASIDCWLVEQPSANIVLIRHQSPCIKGNNLAALVLPPWLACNNCLQLCIVACSRQCTFFCLAASIITKYIHKYMFT